MTDLILGTAQFGSSYGITNGLGRIADSSVTEILQLAQDAGIELFDTAPDYGDAQSRLGKLGLPEFRPRYVSKFALPPEGGAVIDSDSLYVPTLAALGVDRLYGLLFHRVADLRDSRAATAWDVVTQAKNDGIVDHIGASIYDETDLTILIEQFPNLDLIQIPGNILDRRLLDHPDLRRLHDRGVEVHVRSAYLQGLLLANPTDLPVHFHQLAPVLEQVQRHAETSQTSMMAIALGFLKNHPVIDAVVVGATTGEEFADTVDAWTAVSNELVDIPVSELPVEILDPRLWPARGALA